VVGRKTKKSPAPGRGAGGVEPDWTGRSSDEGGSLFPERYTKRYLPRVLGQKGKRKGERGPKFPHKTFCPRGLCVHPMQRGPLKAGVYTHRPLQKKGLSVKRLNQGEKKSKRGGKSPLPRKKSGTHHKGVLT